MTIEYYTIGKDQSIDSVLKQLDKRYHLSNLYPFSRPFKLMGNAKILELRMAGKLLKIDGPGFVVDSVYNKLIQGQK
jgi:hypothetical protein